MNILKINKFSNIADMDFYDILISIAISFVFGMLVNRFIDKKTSNYYDNNQDQQDNHTNNKTLKKDDLYDKDIKMVFVCKVQGKHQNTLLAEKTAEGSVELYKDILLNGSEYNKKVLDIWDTFGSKKIVLKLNEINELEIIYNSLKSNNIPCYKLIDFPLLVIGPEVSEEINKYTGHLKLMS